MLITVILSGIIFIISVILCIKLYRHYRGLTYEFFTILLSAIQVNHFKRDFSILIIFFIVYRSIFF